MAAQGYDIQKKGFENPIAQWLRGKMRPYIGDCLLSEETAVVRYFNRNYVNEFISLHEEGKEDYMRHIYL